MNNMNKIIVIGCPGSGKSTFSRALHKKTNIPLYHLDMMYWNGDKTTVRKEEFLKRLIEALQKDSWIIDGNYSSTMEMRLKSCDTVIFLDYSLEVCLDGIKERQGKPRSDMPWIETEEDKEFVEYIMGFNSTQRPNILLLLEKYKNEKTIITFKSRKEAEDFLDL